MTSALTTRVNARAYERRWLILAVLCFSLLVIVLDNTILNVAIPTIVRDLDATNSQLQWMVDSYTLVFAGLLLTAGALGDRFGRRGALQFGLVVFGIGSLASAFAQSADQLIATRAFMGIGGAFIMPATLSIITNVFPPGERGKAIGVWAGTAGLAGVLGPTIGGFLLEHFYWGSVFLVNIPIVVVGILAGVFLIPTSKDPEARPLDPIGAVLSIVGLVALLYGIIEAPQNGWTDPTILAAFAVGIVLLLAFIAWEAHTEYPMLDVNFFKNPRFSAASLSIMFVFFSMFGTLFLLTQYLQFVLGYSPFETGIRFLPLALVMLIGAPLSAPLANRFGTKIIVTIGMTAAGASLLSFATLTADSSYWPDVVWRLMLMAGGMALVMAPATESIMGSLPLAKAGVGSAVNDTTRQVGGALGVAIIGSVLSSTYGSQMTDFLAGKPVSSGTSSAIQESLGAALGYANQIASQAPALAQSLAVTAEESYVDGMHAGVLVGAGVTLVGAVIAAIWLPARARQSDIEAQQVAHDQGQDTYGVVRTDTADAEVATSERAGALVTNIDADLRRMPGRPRSIEADAAILEATIELFADTGYEALTVEGVAARAGVSKATVYRRYPGKVDLVVAACRAYADVTRAAPDSGSLRGDVRALVENLVAMLTTTPVGRVVPMLVADRARVPELDAEQRAVVREKRDRYLAVVEHAATRDELRPGVDPEVVVDACVGPVFYRFLVSRAPLDGAFVDGLVDAVVHAFER